MEGINFNIHSKNENFEYHIANNERITIEIENVNGELKVNAENTENNYLNLANGEYDYLDLYEHDYAPERHKSSIDDILKSRKEKTTSIDTTEARTPNSAVDREDIINQYIRKHSS